MAYHLIRSPRLEDLIAHHRDIFLKKDLFDDSLLVIVQNQQTSDWLSHTLSRAQGILMNFSCQLTEQAFRRLALGFPQMRKAVRLNEKTGEMDRPFLFDDDLQLLIYHTIQNSLDHPQLGFIQDYARRMDTGDVHVHLWNLSRDIASWFAQYARSCRPLMQAWRGNRHANVPLDRETEIWQRFLWHSIFGGDAPAYNFLGDALDRIMLDKEGYDGHIRRVVLVGSAFLNEVYLGFLHFLGKDIDIYHFMLQPMADAHPNPNLPFLLNHKEMYTQLRDFFSGFPGTKIQTLEMEKTTKEHTLGILQHSLYYGQIPQEKIKIDHSIRRITCSDEEREVEVLKDMLLHTLDADETLNLTDIAVLAPDINKYAPYIQAVFDRGEEGQQLAYNIIDLNDSADPSFIQASLGLMNLAGGRFSRKEIFELLDNPLLAQRYRIQDEDRAIWLDFCEKTQILLGKDADQRRKMDLGHKNINTFDHGFFRFILGQTYGEIDTKLGQTLASMGQQTAEKIRNFTLIIQQLYEDFYPLAGMKNPLYEWLDVIEKRLTYHLSDKSAELKPLRVAFSHLRESCAKMSALPYGQQPLSYFIAKEIISDVLRRQKRKIGRYLAHGIVCSSLIPLRALPFKIIIILGLNNGEFPQSAVRKNREYDLMQSPGIKAMSKINAQKQYLDRYAFLETIFSAREQLWLFHQDRDSITGEKLSPSSSLADLELYLQSVLCHAQDLAQHQVSFPKSPFSPDLFRSTYPWKSFDTYHLSLAKVRHGGQIQSQQEKLPWSMSEETQEDPPAAIWHSAWQDNIQVHQLQRFAKSPIIYFFDKVLGVDHSMLSESDAAEQQDEHYELTSLEQYALYENLIIQAIEAGEDFSWHRFINDDRGRRLKEGNISHALLSRQAYIRLEKYAEWISESLGSLHPGRMSPSCVFHDKQEGAHILPCAKYQIEGKTGVIHGQCPMLFADHTHKAIHYIHLNARDNQQKQDEMRKYSTLAQDYLYFLLCRLAQSEYDFYAHVFCLKNKEYLNVQFAPVEIEEAQNMIDNLSKSFLLSKAEAPYFSIYQTNKLTGDEKELIKLNSLKKRLLFKHEKELLRSFYSRCNNFTLQKL